MAINAVNALFGSLDTSVLFNNVATAALNQVSGTTTSNSPNVYLGGTTPTQAEVIALPSSITKISSASSAVATTISIQDALTQMIIQNASSTPQSITANFQFTLTNTYNQDEMIVFTVMPENFQDSSTAEYDFVQLLHAPGSQQLYRNSTSRSMTVNTKMISRSKAEAQQNLEDCNIMKSWTKPYFGKNVVQGDPIGAPPPVLKMNYLGMNQFFDVPVVLKSISIDYDSESDLVGTSDSINAMPAIFNISLVLLETYSPTQMEQFDLNDFKQGYVLNQNTLNSTRVQSNRSTPSLPTGTNTQISKPDVNSITTYNQGDAIKAQAKQYIGSFYG